MDIAILITLIGMTLVFSAILLIWLAITLIVRFTNRAEDAAEPEAAAPETEPAETANQETERRRRAALVALAVALADQEHTTRPNVPELPPPTIVSAWQVAMRTSNMNLKRPTSR